MDSADSRKLPGTLVGIMAGFFVVPWWSLCFFNPWTALSVGWGAEVLTHTVLPLAAYWVVPLLLVGLIWKRSLLLLPTYVGACALIIAHSFLHENGTAGVWLAVRVTLLGTMTALGFLLMSKEIVFPLLRREKRGFRAAPRLYANRPARMCLEGADTTTNGAPIMIENCSLTGMLLFGPKTGPAAPFTALARGSKMRVTVRVGSTMRSIPVTLVWQDELGDSVRFGVQAADSELMTPLVESLGAATKTSEGGRTAAGAGRWERLLARKAVRATALAAWISTLGGSLAIPACGALSEGAKKGSMHTDAINYAPEAKKPDLAHGSALAAVDPDGVTVPIAIHWQVDGDDASVGESEAGLRLTDEKTAAPTLSYRLQHCASGADRAGVSPDTPHVIRGDRGCELVLVSFTLSAATPVQRAATEARSQKTRVVYTALDADQLDGRQGATNNYAGPHGETIGLVNSQSLPNLIADAVSVAFKVASVSADDGEQAVVALPLAACSIVFDKATRGQQPYTVRIHPVYLQTAAKLKTLYVPCRNGADACPTQTIEASGPFAYATTFNAKVATPVAGAYVSASVTIENEVLRKKVEDAGVSMSCTGAVP